MVSVYLNMLADKKGGTLGRGSDAAKGVLGVPNFVG